MRPTARTRDRDTTTGRVGADAGRLGRRAGRPGDPVVRRRGGPALLVVVGLVVALLAGCSASDGSSSSASSGGSGGAQPVRAGAAEASDASGKAAPPMTGQQLARTARMSLQVRDVPGTAAKVRAEAAAAGGQVTSEDLSSGSVEGSAWSGSRDGGPTGTVVIEVPGNRLDATLDALGRLGTVGSREVTSEDVTTQVVDTRARLQTMRASVTRVRALMSDATKLGDVVALESELAKREADLESLEGQLADLTGRVAMSPVTVTLSTQAVVAVASTGFVEGLRNGWGAFVTTSRVVLTAVGALLPFALFLGAVGVPLLLWWRRRAARQSPAPTPTTTQA